MKKFLPISLLSVPMFLIGCSSTNALTSEQKMQIVQQHQQQKTFEIECEYGCKVSYKDPRDKVQLPKETNGYDVANTLINGAVGVATTVAPWAAVGVIATQGIKHSGDNYNDSYNTTDANNVDNTSVPTVVNQPDPVIVEQPEPVIVEQPEPTIVNPVVVDPVVVETQPTP